MNGSLTMSNQKKRAGNKQVPGNRSRPALPEGKEALIKRLIVALSLAAISGCISTPNESSQELRHFIADQVTASTKNIQNELWPWMVLIMAVYVVGKASGMIMYWLQHRGLKRAINGGASRPAARKSSAET